MYLKVKIKSDQNNPNIKMQVNLQNRQVNIKMLSLCESTGTLSN